MSLPVFIKVSKPEIKIIELQFPRKLHFIFCISLQVTMKCFQMRQEHVQGINYRSTSIFAVSPAAGRAAAFLVQALGSLRGGGEGWGTALPPGAKPRCGAELQVCLRCAGRVCLIWSGKVSVVACTIGTEPLFGTALFLSRHNKSVVLNKCRRKLIGELSIYG